MRALTLTQPWASLVAGARHPNRSTRFGTKHCTSRSWRTAYRGPLAIHAGKGLADRTEAAYRDLCRQEPFRRP